MKVAPISNVRLTSNASVFTSLSWSADIFRACYSISLHMRQSERETDGEILTVRKHVTAHAARCLRTLREDQKKTEVALFLCAF